MSPAAVSSTWNRPLEPPQKLPAAADVVIIGGGIVGVSTAWFLAKQGVDVVICEKGHIAGEQSGRNWGWVRQQGRDVREMPMIVESLKIWRTLAEDIGEDVDIYASLWGYSLGETEPRLPLFEYPEYDFAVTKELTNLQVTLSD